MPMLMPTRRWGRSARALLLLGVWVGALALGCQDELPEATLHDAVELEDLGRVTELLEKGADPNEVNAEGSPALHVAASLGFVDIGLELLAYDASARSLDAQKRTPLHLASNGEGMQRLVMALLERGGDPSARDARGRTPMFASLDRHVARLLLHAGADPMARDDEGQTPLHVAASTQRGGTMVVLIERGADVNAVDYAGQTPLHRAALDPSTFLAFTLLQHGADVDAQDLEGFTPLHVAAERGQRRIVRQLLDAGADTSVEDEQGRTALDLAKNADRTSIVRLMSARIGADRHAEALRLLEEAAEAEESARAAEPPSES